MNQSIKSQLMSRTWNTEHCHSNRPNKTETYVYFILTRKYSNIAFKWDSLVHPVSGCDGDGKFSAGDRVASSLALIDLKTSAGLSSFWWHR